MDLIFIFLLITGAIFMQMQTNKPVEAKALKQDRTKNRR